MEFGFGDLLLEIMSSWFEIQLSWHFEKIKGFGVRQTRVQISLLMGVLHFPSDPLSTLHLALCAGRLTQSLFFCFLLGLASGRFWQVIWGWEVRSGYLLSQLPLCWVAVWLWLLLTGVPLLQLSLQVLVTTDPSFPSCPRIVKAFCYFYPWFAFSPLADFL